MAGLWSILVKLVLPTRCVLCSSVGLENVCDTCAVKLERIWHCCQRCGRRKLTMYASPDCGECHGHNIGVSAARSMFIYNAAGRELLAEFKFNRREAAGAWMAQQLADFSLRISWPAKELQPQLVVPVPIHGTRLRERGFNQATTFGGAVAKSLKLRQEVSLLRRIRPTPTQVGLSASQRRLNVRGAFGVDVRNKPKLEGRVVLLVDDLMTTGATLRAAALELRRGGAKAVLGLTAFSTVHDVESPDWDVPAPLVP
jgi:ComF family protein